MKAGGRAGGRAAGRKASGRMGGHMHGFGVTLTVRGRIDAANSTPFLHWSTEIGPTIRPVTSHRAGHLARLHLQMRSRPLPP